MNAKRGGPTGRPSGLQLSRLYLLALTLPDLAFVHVIVWMSLAKTFLPAWAKYRPLPPLVCFTEKPPLLPVVVVATVLADLP